MKYFSRNLDLFSSVHLIDLTLKHLKYERYGCARHYLSFYVERHPSDAFLRFLYAFLLRYSADDNTLIGIKESESALLKVLEDFPEILEKPEVYFLFWLKLAESFYDSGRLDEALTPYSIVVSISTNVKDLFRLAELKANKNCLDPSIVPILLSAISDDPTKKKIKDHLITIVVENERQLTPKMIREIAAQGFVFSNGWFLGNILRWDRFIPIENPRRILEIGSHEGQFASYLIDKLADNNSLEIHCMDKWNFNSGSPIEGDQRPNVEARFDYNLKHGAKNKANIKVFKHKGLSDSLLSKMIASGMVNYFDFIYVNSADETPAILDTAIMAFKLLKIGGVLGFDEYGLKSISEIEVSHFDKARADIDIFTNLYKNKIKLICNGDEELWHHLRLNMYERKLIFTSSVGEQVWIRKRSD
ncbi:Methyltransferase domain containing protein [Oxalobacteraceae bacterium]